MNPLIEFLNLWGEHFVSLAWPLLWQSSLLIVVLLALDFALRRRVRAAVRYALWLVVLVKLVLPPSLALPTGLGWWLQPRHAPPTKPQPTFVVTYGNSIATELPPVVEAAYTLPPLRLSRDGWALAACAAVSAVLFGWMGVRWRQIARDIRRAIPAPPWLDELLTAARGQAGLRRRVDLRLTARPMSPAVCGLFRPVILLPRSLVEQLPPAQLRSVLLHELIHLRRGDVWVNCAQALLQVVYWWHPLLWLANSRIRRAREEAVDDAVMLALRNDAESYASTLLEVAKLAFHRPLASLGLVGILESRRALRERLERLVPFRPPRKAGLTIGSALCVLFFAAVAIPMERSSVVRSESIRVQGTLAYRAESGSYPVRQEFYFFSLTVEDRVWNIHLAPQKPGPRTLLYSEIGCDGEMLYAYEEANTNGLAKEPSNETGTPPAYQAFAMIIPDTLPDPMHFRCEPLWLAYCSSLEFVTNTSGYARQIWETANTVSGGVFTNLPVKAHWRWLSSSKRYLSEIQYFPKTTQGRDDTSPLVVYKVTHTKVLQGVEVPVEFEFVRYSELDSAKGVPFMTFIGHATNVMVGPHIADPRPKIARPALMRDFRTGAEPPAEFVVSDGRWPKRQVMPSTRLGPVAFARLALPMGKRPINSVALNSVDEPARKTNNAPTATSTSSLVGEPSSAANASQRGAPAETIEKFFVEKRPIWENTPGPRYSYSGKVGLLLNVEVRADGSCWAGSNRLDLSQLSAVLPQVERTNSPLGVDIKADVKAPLQSIATLFYRLQHLGVASISLTTIGEGANLVQTRSFKLDVNTFLPNLDQKAGSTDPIGTEDVSVALRKVLSDVGVNLQTLEFCFYSDRKDLLFVRATQTDMEHVQALVEELNSAPPQVTVEAKFIEMPERDYRDLWARFTPMNHPPTGAWTAILTSTEARELVKELQSKPGLGDMIVAPRVTTLSGRRAQVMSHQPHTNLAEWFNLTKVPFGHSLDVTATVSADGYTIVMPVAPTVIEVMNEEDSKQALATLEKLRERVSLPVLRGLRPVRERSLGTIPAVVWDGQTLMLGNFRDLLITKNTGGSEAVMDNPDAKRTQLLVLITPTITDSAGNLIHSEKEMPFEWYGVPPQPPR